MSLHSKIWLIVASIALFIGFTFWSEISESWKSSVGALGSRPISDERNYLPVEDTERIRGFVLGAGLVEGGSTLTTVASAKVSNQRLVDKREGFVAVAFELDSTSMSHDYPSLRVSLSDAQGNALREFVLSNAQYNHGASLSHETVVLPLKLQGRESKLHLSAFYPGSAP